MRFSMLKKAAVLLASLLIFIQYPADAATWKKIYGDGQSVIWIYFDTDSVKNIGNKTYSVWIKSVLNPYNQQIRTELRSDYKKIYVESYGDDHDPSVVNKMDRVSYYVELVKYDFNLGRSKPIVSHYYLDDGSLLPEMSINVESEWQHVVPDSIGEITYTFLKKNLMKAK